MPVLGCDVEELLELSSCYLCFSERELLAAKAMLQEEFFSGAASARTPAELAADSVAWKNLSESQRLAIEVRQLCNANVILGERTDCDANTLAEQIACYCGLSKSQLEAISYYLTCLQRQT